MTLETRIRRSLEAQRDAVPARIEALSHILDRGRRRLRWRRGAIAFAGSAALGAAVVATAVVLNNPAAVAVSPITGDELTISHESPTLLQAHLAPEPDERPEGADLTFTPVGDATDADLDAIDQIIELEQYESPVTVSLGAIESAQTHVYVIHDVDPETRSGRSTVIAVGPDYPSFVAHSGPTEHASWAFSAGRQLNGDGWIAMGVPDFASYFQIDVNGTKGWQRPADGFIWIPFTARPDDDVVVTGHDSTGRIYLRHTLEASPITDTVEQARATVQQLEARIAELEAEIGSGEGDLTELDAIREAHREAVARLEAIQQEVNSP